MPSYCTVGVFEVWHQWEISNITAHAASEQHSVSMLRSRAEQVKASRVPIAGCCPIAKSLLALKKLMQEKLIKSLISPL